MAQAGGIASMGGLANQGLTTGAIPVTSGLQGTFGSTQQGQFGPPPTQTMPPQGGPLQGMPQPQPAQGNPLQGMPQPFQPQPANQMNYQQLMNQLGLNMTPQQSSPGPVQPNQSPLPFTIQSPGTALQDGSLNRPLPSAQPNFQTMVMPGALPMGLGQQR